MKNVSNNEILLDYLKKEIIKMGFVKINNTIFSFGKLKPCCKIYHVRIKKLEFTVNTYDIEFLSSIINRSNNFHYNEVLKNLYLSNLIKNQSYEDKIIKTNEFLNYLSKTDEIRNRITIKKIAKIKEKL